MPRSCILGVIKLRQTQKGWITMDIAKIITEAVDKLLKDDKLLESFKKDPVKTLEKQLGIDLPDEQINAVIKGIKAKIDVDDVLGTAGKLLGMLGKK